MPELIEEVEILPSSDELQSHCLYVGQEVRELSALERIGVWHSLDRSMGDEAEDRFLANQAYTVSLWRDEAGSLNIIGTFCPRPTSILYQAALSRSNS